MKVIIKFKPIIQLIFIILTILGIFKSYLWTINAIIIVSVLSGPTHCGFICPFGTIQEWLNTLAKKLNIKQFEMPIKYHKYFKYLRYVLLLSFLLLNLDLMFTLLKLDARASFNSILVRETITTFSLITFVIFTILSLKFNRFFCNYLCIEGAKQGLISIFRPITIHKNDTCVNCKKCDQSCPMQIEISSKGVIKDPSCINCFKCIDVCPIEKTLNYKPIKLKSENLIYYMIPIIIIGFMLNGFSSIADFHKENHHLITQETPILEEIVEEISNTPTIVESNKTTNIFIDGFYTGKARGFRNYIEVEIQIKSDEIIDIQVIEQHEDYRWYKRAVSIIDTILTQQSTDVDLISGATYSSRGIRDAVKEALKKAKDISN